MRKMLFIFGVLLFACTEENANSVAPIAPYSSFNPGSYWIYEWYITDDVTGIKKLYGKTDSVFIEKDTVIDGNKYFIEKGTFLGNRNFKSIKRGVADHIIDKPNNDVVFSLNEDFIRTDTSMIGDEILYIGYTSRESGVQNISVPAGNFDVVNYKSRIEFKRPGFPIGTRYCYLQYAANVGQVLKSITFSSSPDVLTSELLRYHIE
jgi:hypothetical protein